MNWKPIRKGTNSKIYKENSGNNQVDEGFIVNWIGEELYGCEWIDSDEIKFYPDEAVEISTPDGDVYRISVNKIFSSKLGSYLDER